MIDAGKPKPHIPQKDYYTVQDVATLLMTSEGKVPELARRKTDPLPFRCFENSHRGMFISRSELATWVKKTRCSSCSGSRTSRTWCRLPS